MSITDTIKQSFECWEGAGWRHEPGPVAHVQASRLNSVSITLKRVGVRTFSIGVRGLCGWMPSRTTLGTSSLVTSRAVDLVPESDSIVPYVQRILQSVLPCWRGMGGVA
jgi:hypothetical protein